MSSQVVFRLQSRTGHQAIKQFDESIPTIDKHEVLVKIRAVSLNFRDIGVANGGYPFPVKDGVVPCSDSAGEVIDVGSSVEGFAKGDNVIAVFDPTNLYGPQKDWKHGHGGPVDGFLREYAAVPASALVKIPDGSGLSFSQMAALVCTGVTAWNVLYGNMPIKPGHTVLFQGTGGVSITGLILAKAAGATTIITSSSDEKLELVQKKYGADYTINYKKTPDWASEANKITGGHGVDYIFENGGSGTIKQSIDCIAMGGIISVIGFLSAAKQEDMPDVAGLALSKGAVVRGITVGSKQLLEELVRFVHRKKLSPPVEKEFQFGNDGVQAAFDYLASGNHIGKVCIVMP
ncbi:putative zinc-type alcohol dehydrogenase-like protein [Aaosphaeria arxii CBS 175.79]|uniref:Putative zinc-type alcohol dehydrogenase-like protein n=1 Tax=Aaosphaeria arxii CBS 175.79 TaxID=1450172 RepID=A0A6A5Y2T8_9PLEO|nr:putative zinc-type alcohol dehydrogenase-like protein [Aaosphaeria arxii CBS 175.79]KAF2019569.1 putative zinc-type alcohol dehydrogenase-like protein [Aaosphaeria arxii CBS 175.79]